MSDEQKDESLGVEQLPQTELDFVPGVGEQSLSVPEVPEPPEQEVSQPSLIQDQQNENPSRPT
jgi:hypothetical protein